MQVRQVFARKRTQATLIRTTIVEPALGRPSKPEAAKEAEEVLISSLSVIESFWLKENTEFLVGNSQPSIADLSLACEITQLEFLDGKDHERILGPYKKILRWIDNVKKATGPHFEEVHEILYKAKATMNSMKAGSSANL